MTNPHFNRRAFLASVAGTALAYALDAPAQTAGPRTSITVRIDRDLAVLDPADRTGPWDGNVMRVVFQRLMKQKPNSSELELDAAAEVKQVSPTVIEFRLKPGQMFTDGFGEMTADDVKFSFERIGLPPKDGARESTYKNDWLYLQGVEVKSKYEGRIVLTQPRANLFDVVIGDGSGMHRLAEGGRAARRGLRDQAGRLRALPARLARAPEGRHAAPQSRVCRPQAALRGDRDPLHLRRAHDRSRAALRRARLRGAGAGRRRAAALGGRAHGQRAAEHRLRLARHERGEGAASDLRVRQAIRLALDVDQMLAAGYNGKAPRLNTLLPPQILGHWREAPVYKRNVAEAKSLLAAAGVSNLKVKLLILNQAHYQSMALVARALLAEVGITVEVDAQEGGTFWNSGKGDTGKNIDLFIIRFNGKHDPELHHAVVRLRARSANWNWQRWNSPEFDALYAQSAGEVDPAKRRQLVVDAQRLMDKSAAFVWLTNEANTLVYRNWIRPGRSARLDRLAVRRLRRRDLTSRRRPAAGHDVRGRRDAHRPRRCAISRAASSRPC